MTALWTLHCLPEVFGALAEWSDWHFGIWLEVKFQLIVHLMC